MPDKKSSDKINLVAPCGLYCGECLGYQQKICDGCRSQKGICLKYQKVCGIYECCVKKNKFDFCYQCKCFPCKIFIKWFEGKKSPWFREMVSNLKRIRKSGLLRHLVEEEKRVRELKRCAKEKKIVHCSYCKDWPCEKNETFASYPSINHSNILQNVGMLHKYRI